VAGKPAWHIHAIHATVPALGTDDATVDLFIAQTSDLPLRLALHAAPRLGSKVVHERVHETFRRFGEPVKVTIPAPCR